MRYRVESRMFESDKEMAQYINDMADQGWLLFEAQLKRCSGEAASWTLIFETVALQCEADGGETEVK